MNHAGLDVTRLWTLLGHPDGPQPARGCDVTQCATFADHAVEEIRIETAGGRIPATLFRPLDPGPHPAVLYCHAHGNRYDIGRRELAEGRPALQPAAYGPLLAARGFVTLCADMPGFGDRQAEGSEAALAKAAFWQGRTLFGDMLADLSAALDVLTGRADVDDTRIATFGISMGATHGYWLAALDARVVATAHLCAFAGITGLIEAGGHDLHGIYMTVPGLLRHGDMGDVAALVAPRPQMVGAGGTDPLTPPRALQPALATLSAAYAEAGAAQRLTTLVSAETGHVETPQMRAAVLDFLEKALVQP
ncbi:CocE/NonD family hydrolase [Oricola sp.]|uniref:dienelactone hydrolase family protein n=1 Tax=Oricola sp. TaxID=1979950 RepID=UPI0025D6F9E3|nr:CocE/NonD family hydrolase [Oricola sp.]MCI5076002.1 hypothetical protein [Oricola sp.]